MSKPLINNEARPCKLIVQLKKKMVTDRFNTMTRLGQEIGVSKHFLSILLNSSSSVVNIHRANLEKIATYLEISVVQAHKWANSTTPIPMNTLTDQARYVAHRRKELEMTQKDATKFFGLGKGSFGYYESGMRTPPVLLLMLLAAYGRYPRLMKKSQELADYVYAPLVTPTYISYMRVKLALTKRDAAILFGLGRAAFSQIESGDRDPPFTLMLLFNLIKHRPALLEELRQLFPQKIGARLPDKKSKPTKANRRIPTPTS